MSKLWRSTFVFSGMTTISRVFGLVRDMVIMNVFGAGALMDAFLVAFKIPNFLRRLFAEGAFSQAFVPVLSEYKTNQSLAEVQRLVASASGALLLILSILTVAVIALAPVVVGLFAPGFADSPYQFNTAVELLRITFPYLLFISMTAFAGSVLNSYGSFAAPAFAPVLLNLSFIAAALWVAPSLDKPIMALGWAVFVAGILQFMLQVPQLWQRKLLPRPKVDFTHEGVRRILKLMLPALFGVSVTQINLLLNTVFASFMVKGSVSWLYAAERMSELPLGLIGVAIGTVILPSLSAQHAKKDTLAFSAMLDWAAKVIFLVGVPASIALFMLSGPIIETLFMHGKFTQADADMSALALQALSGGVLAFMLIKIFAPGFFARQDTKTPVKIGIIAVVANIVLSACLIAILHYVFAVKALHVALAAASTLAAFINATLLYINLHKQNVFRFGGHWRKICTQYAIANTAMMLCLALLISFYDTYAGSQVLRVVFLVGMCVAGAAAYALGLLATGFRPRHLKH